MKQPGAHRTTPVTNIVPRIELGEYRFRTRGLDIWYRVAGKGPVLIIQAPGWGIGCAPYESTLAPLEDRFTVVYYDPRGSGRSMTPKDVAEINVGEMVEDLEALRTHLGLDAFTLLGHSHGGLIALHYALKHPGRLSRLITVASQIVGALERADDPGDAPDSFQGDAGFQEAMKFFQSVGGFGALFRMTSDDEAIGFLRRILPLYFYHSSFYHSSNVAPLARSLVGARIPLRTALASGGSDQSYPLTGRLQTLSVPTLVLAGRYDVICPVSGARALHWTIPGSELVVFGRSGHFPWIEEPQPFFQAVTRFLT